MALTCPSCGNDRNFLVKTLQMHIVRLDDARVEVNDEGRPGGHRGALRRVRNRAEFRGFRRGHAQGDAADARRPLTLQVVPSYVFRHFGCITPRCFRLLPSSRIQGRSIREPIALWSALYLARDPPARATPAASTRRRADILS